MKNMYVTACITPSAAGPNPQFSVYILPANYDFIQDINNIIYGKYYGFYIVPSSPVPALDGTGTFLSADDAIAYFLANDLSTIISNTIDAVNTYYGTTVYQYAGYIKYSDAISAALPKSYNGGTVRSSPIQYTNTANVTTGGNVVFYLTDDGTSGGNLLFPNNIDFMKGEINNSTTNYNYGYTLSNSNKTLTVNVQNSSATTILGISVLGVPSNAASGTTVNILVTGN